MGRVADFATLARFIASGAAQRQPKGETMIQAELTELETLSRRLDSCSTEVADLMRALTTLINTTTWTGSAADRFRHAWETHFNPALRSLSTELVNATQKVDRRKHMIGQAAGH
jgi:WXG100 family type VII secretion target